jgi:two-component system, cell cycle response regulator
MDTHILIVDDDDTIRYLMKEFIETVGYQTQTAADAEEALSLLDSNPFEVVITDIMMPGMDGLELTERIKQDHDIEVIVMTGYSGDYSYKEAIDKGASDFVFKPVRFEELLLRLRRVLRERQLRKELQNLAITDGLTKLYNSRHFYAQLELEVERTRRHRRPLGLLLMDIDYFKQYNDRYGHLEGDKVLAKLGRAIQESLRKTDSAYRYGGEEFTIILPETCGKESITVAQRVRSAIAARRFQPEDGEPTTITVSMGVTEYQLEEKITDFVKRADKAMFISKQKGRDRITVLYPNREAACETSSDGDD